jgi:hypothetical protein
MVGGRVVCGQGLRVWSAPAAGGVGGVGECGGGSGPGLVVGQWFWVVAALLEADRVGFGRDDAALQPLLHGVPGRG